MNGLEAGLLGIIQGLTEFLPVSSSGHLVVFQKLLGLEHHDLVFDVAVHLGTMASVLTIYRKLLLRILTEGILGIQKKSMNDSLHLVSMLILGSLPTALIGFTLKDQFEALFSNLQAVSIAFVFTGAVLFFTGNKNKGQAFGKVDDLSQVYQLTWWKALLVGVAQGAAITPGISRSGMTIAAGIYLNMPRSLAAAFSFMLSIPAIVGAAALQLRELQTWDVAAFQILGLGFVVSYLSGLFGLWLVLNLVGKGRLEVFSYYLWVLGPIIFFWSLG